MPRRPLSMAQRSRNLPAAIRGLYGSRTLENKDSFAERNQLQLVGYDSRDGKGERIIWGDRANYYRPLITPDGQQIVISNRQTRKIYVIKWDESRPRLLKEPGCATEVWRDPQYGKNLGLLSGKSKRLYEASLAISDR